MSSRSDQEIRVWLKSGTCSTCSSRLHSVAVPLQEAELTPEFAVFIVNLLGILFFSQLSSPEEESVHPVSSKIACVACIPTLAAPCVLFVNIEPNKVIIEVSSR